MTVRRTEGYVTPLGIDPSHDLRVLGAITNAEGNVKIGLNMDSLGSLPLDDALDVAAGLGLRCVEFPTGAWSSAT